MADKNDDYYGFGDMDLEDDDLTPGSTRSTRQSVQGEKSEKPGFFESAEAAAAPGIKQAKEGWKNLSGADVARGAGRLALGAAIGPGAASNINLLEDALILAAKPFGDDAVSKVRDLLGIKEDDPGTMSRLAGTVGKMGEGIGKLGSDAYDAIIGRETDEPGMSLGGLVGGALGGTVGGVARGADPTRAFAMSREDPGEQLLAMSDVATMGAPLVALGAKGARVGRGAALGVPGRQSAADAADLFGKWIDELGPENIDAAHKFTPEQLQALRNEAALEKMAAMDVLNPPKKAARAALERRMAQRGLAPDEIPEGFSGDLGGGTDWGMSLEPPPNASMVSDIGTGGARPGNVKGWSVPEVPDAPKTSMSEVPAPVTGVHKPAGVDLDFGTPTDYGIDIGPLAQANQRMMDAEDLMGMVRTHEATRAATGGKSLAEMQAELARLKALGEGKPGLLDPLMSRGAQFGAGVRDVVSSIAPGKGKILEGMAKIDQSLGPVGRVAVPSGMAGMKYGPLAGAGVAAALTGRELVKALVANPAGFDRVMSSLEAAGRIPPGMAAAEALQFISRAAAEDPRFAQEVQNGLTQ